jgi:uncharacterized iron-regulated membrane protein
VYGGLVLLVLALTGIALAVPQYVNPLIDLFSPVATLPAPQSHASEAAQPDIGVDRAVDVARHSFPQARVRWIETPGVANGVYRIRMQQPGEPGRRFPKTFVWVDRYSAAVLATHDPARSTAGTGLVDWMHPLHSGEGFGRTGQVVVLFAGLLLPVLLITGWLRKKQKDGHHSRTHIDITVPLAAWPHDATTSTEPAPLSPATPRE